MGVLLRGYIGIWTIFLIIISLLGLSCLPGYTSNEGLGDATVNTVINNVFKYEDIRTESPNSKKATEGENFGQYNALRTRKNSRAEIKFFDGSLARVGENALFSFSPENREIHMRKGAALFQVPKNSDETQIHTLSLTATLTGTTIMVGQKPNQSVKAIVIEGSMNLSMPDRAGESRSLESGQMVVMQSDADRIPEPVEVDLQELTNTAKLINGFDDENKEKSEKTGEDGTNQNDGLDLVQMSQGLKKQKTEMTSGELEHTNMVIKGSGTKLTLNKIDKTARDVNTTQPTEDATQEEEKTKLAADEVDASAVALNIKEPTEYTTKEIIFEDGNFVQVFDDGSTNELGGLETIDDVKETFDVPIEGPQQIIVSNGNFVEFYDDGSTRKLGGLTTYDDVYQTYTEIPIEDPQNIIVSNGKFVESYTDGSTRELGGLTTYDQIYNTYQSIPIEDPQEVTVPNGNFVEVYEDGSTRQLDSTLSIADVYGTYQPQSIPVRPELIAIPGDIFHTGESSSDQPTLNGFSGEIVNVGGITLDNVSTDLEFFKWATSISEDYVSDALGLVQADGIRLDGSPTVDMPNNHHGLLVSNGEFRFGNDPFEKTTNDYTIASTLDNYDWNLPQVNANGNNFRVYAAGQGSSLQFNQMNEFGNFQAYAQNSISVSPGANILSTANPAGLWWNSINGSIKTDNNVIQTKGDVVFEGRTPSASISITNSTELRTIADASVKLKSSGGNITVRNSKAGYYDGTNYNYGGNLILDTQNTSEDGTISIMNSFLQSDNTKIRARGQNGLLKIGGSTIKSANNSLKLYARGSQGSVRFTKDTSLVAASSQIDIDAVTVRIDNGVQVDVGTSTTDVYTDIVKYQAQGTNPGTVCSGNLCGEFIDENNNKVNLNTEDPQGGGPSF